MALLYHLIPASNLKSWEPASLYFPPTYQQDGFTHLTADPKLLLDVANRFYADTTGDWELLVLDTAKLIAPVKYEDPAPVGSKPAQEADGSTQFPHLYGGINYDAILESRSVARSASGQFLSIDGF